MPNMSNVIETRTKNTFWWSLNYSGGEVEWIGVIWSTLFFPDFSRTHSFVCWLPRRETRRGPCSWVWTWIKTGWSPEQNVGRPSSPGSISSIKTPNRATSGQSVNPGISVKHMIAHDSPLLDLILVLRPRNLWDFFFFFTFLKLWQNKNDWLQNVMSDIIILNYLFTVSHFGFSAKLK